MTDIKEIAEALEIFESEVFKNFGIHRASSVHNGEYLEITKVTPLQDRIRVEYMEGWHGYPQHRMDSSMVLDNSDWVDIKNLWEESKGGI